MKIGANAVVLNGVDEGRTVVGVPAQVTVYDCQEEGKQMIENKEF